MKEFDKRNSHRSSKLRMIYISSSNGRHRHEYVSTPTSELASFHAGWWEHCHICPLCTSLPTVSNRSLHAGAPRAFGC